MGHEMTAVFIGLMLTMHVQAVVMAPVLFSREPMRMAGAKIVFGACMVIFIAWSIYYFIYRKHGEEIVKLRGESTDNRFATLVGWILFFETLLLPILVVIVVGGQTKGVTP